MIDFEAELDRLAADLAVFDVACGAGTRVNWRLEALAAIRAPDQLKLHTARGAVMVRRYAGFDYRLETVFHVNALRIAWFHVGPGSLLGGNGPFHKPTIRPTAAARQCLQRVKPAQPTTPELGPANLARTAGSQRPIGRTPARSAIHGHKMPVVTRTLTP